MDTTYVASMMATAIAALFGVMVKLQNDRITDRDQQVTKLELDNRELSDELKITALKVEQIIKTEQDATRQELSELRKTNSALVATISGRAVTT